MSKDGLTDHEREIGCTISDVGPIEGDVMEKETETMLICPFCFESVKGILKEDETGSSGIIDKKDHYCPGFEICLKEMNANT